MNKVEIFNPGIAALKEIADKYRGMVITDEASYKEAKAARKELGDMRIKITKFGKSKRDEAIAFQKEVIRQEREHVIIITEVEDDIKAKIAEVDEARKREERKVLLPSRKAMLEEIKCEMTDDEILDLDEKQFSEMYTAKKMEYMEEKERAQKEREEKKQRKEELEKAKKEAAEKARKEAEEKAEKDKQEAIDKIKREQEEKERKEKEEEDRKKKEEEDRIAAEKLDLERAEKNRKYKKWIAEVGVNIKAGDKVERIGDTFVAYKKIGEITIK